MQHNNKLTYVMSGAGHSKIIVKGITPETIANIRKIFAKLNSEPSHTFGLLYNAWTEHKFGSIFEERFKGSVDLIQADSGGLQIITRGMSVTDSIKEKVYYNQGKWSDMAMAFDEIPLKTVDNKTQRTVLSSRWFDEASFEYKARETGKNIRKQIETFLKMGSDAKPIFITQGNCYDTYMKWTEYALSEIPRDLHSQIGGIAMGAAALGHGTLEDVRRAFIYTQLPIEFECNHLHLLAVGSVFRLVPNLIFINSGLYKNLHLTYDSTTHSSGYNYGRMYLDGRALDFPQTFDKRIHQRIYDKIESIFWTLDDDVYKFYDTLKMSLTDFTVKYGSSDFSILCAMLLIGCSIYEFKRRIDYVLDHPEEIIVEANQRDSLFANSLKHLSEVKSVDDFRVWENHFSRYIKSDAVSSQPFSTLEDFFV